MSRPDTRNLSAAAPGPMVVIGADGIVLPAVGGTAARPLGLDELVLLQELAASRAPTPAVGGEAPVIDGNTAGPSPAVADNESLVLVTPVVVVPGRAGFDWLDHDGRVRARLTAVELAAIAELLRPAETLGAFRRQAEHLGDRSLSRGEFFALVGRLLDVGVVQRANGADPGAARDLPREVREMRRSVARQAAVEHEVRRAVAKHAGDRRRGTIPVVPIHFQWQNPPLALGMIVAYLRRFAEGMLLQHYDFVPAWLTDEGDLAQWTREPAVFLFSHYVWSSEQNLALSARLKEANPSCLTIHGGPNVPKYAGDLEDYLLRHRHVDVAVSGEGEQTAAELLAALVPVLAAKRRDLAELASVPGVAFRVGEKIVRTPERGRIEDVDSLPSPYLDGLFDSYGAASPLTAIVETNRGCPYGCTFCDWGSATLSRIRKFSLDRVFAELEWCAGHGVQSIGLADANFGVFERDVEIAAKAVELRRRFGVPRHFGVNYAKNSVKNLKPIVESLVDAGVLSYGLVSLQSTDPVTLATIRRSNIKVDKYHELANEFRKAGLPLLLDLMMGLPGSTVESFRGDLQEAIDREIMAKIHPTQLLVNSPMNEPEYRRANGIRALPGEKLEECGSFSRADYERMGQLRRAYILLEKFGLLRHVARFVRQEAGVREIDFYERFWNDVHGDRERWPVSSFALEVLPDLMVPPGRWRLFLDEVGRYLVEEIGLADDSSLATVLAVQEALLPARHRTFPANIELRHDYAGWHAAMVAAKEGGHVDDWSTTIPRLRSFAPGTLQISDPHDVCALGMGWTLEADIWMVFWELGSPVSRPVRPIYAAVD